MKLVDLVALVCLFAFIRLGQLIGHWPGPSAFVLWLAIFIVLAIGRFWTGERLR